MAKMFEFTMNRSEMRETEKAYGFCYERPNKNHAGVWETAWQWLPKSQTTVEDIEFDGEDIYWAEGDVLVSVPMWLARKENYFKGTLCRTIKL